MSQANDGTQTNKTPILQQVRGFVVLMRPEYTLFVGFVIFAGMFLALGGTNRTFILPLIVTVLHYSAICIKDDVEDYDIDVRLDRSRPLVEGSVSIKVARWSWIIFHGLALPLAWLVNLPFFILMLTYPFIGIAYSIEPLRISDKGVWGNIYFVGFSLSLPFIAGVVAIQGASIRLELLFVAFCLWLWGLTIDFLKDFIQLDRNKQENRTSFVLQLGKAQATKLYAIFTLSYYLVFPIPIFFLELNFLYLIIMGIIAMWLLFSTSALLRDYTNGTQWLVKSHTYALLPLLMLLGLVVGSF